MVRRKKIHGGADPWKYRCRLNRSPDQINSENPETAPSQMQYLLKTKR